MVETSRYSLKMNKAIDGDVIERLDHIGNVQGYIKMLVRADIEKERSSGSKVYSVTPRKRLKEEK